MIYANIRGKHQTVLRKNRQAKLTFKIAFLKKVNIMQMHLLHNKNRSNAASFRYTMWKTNKQRKKTHFLTDNESVEHLYCTYCSHVIGHTGSFWFCSLFSVSNFTFLNITVFSETFFFFLNRQWEENFSFYITPLRNFMCLIWQ